MTRGFKMLSACCVMAALCAARCGASDFSREAVGTTSGQFLKLAPGARGAALGEAYTALVDDASALYWNPAGLIKIATHSVTLMHAVYLADTYFDYAAFAKRYGDIGTVALSVQYMNSGAITQTDSSGVDSGQFTPYDVAVSLGLATYVLGMNRYPEERFVLGASAKIVSSRIIEQDTTLAADIGILTPFFLNNRMQCALVFQNIMGSLRFDEEGFPLPFMGRLGARLKMASWWDLTADMVAPNDNAPYFASGAEMRAPLSGSLKGALRAGFNTRAYSDYEGFRNISFGLGLGNNALSADYAINPFGMLGNSHRLSLTFSF